jgi:5-methylcytosine-specific restriction endonuclease McrA
LSFAVFENERARRRRGSARRYARGWRRGRNTGRWRRICERDGWICWVCQAPIDPTLRPPHRLAGSVDHVVALFDGGSDADDSNVRAAHLTCNVRRGKLTRLAPPMGLSA